MENVVIGAGPAGRVGSLELGKLEEDTILIERKHIAGTCLNEGCMVINALTDVSRYLNNHKKYSNHGFINGSVELDYKLLTQKIRETQEKLRVLEQKECEEAGNRVIFGEATVNEDTVSVNGETFKFKNLMVATGGRPFIPNIEGSENAYVSSNMLDLDEVPEKMNIIGGGVIAAEMANIYSSYGAEVNVFVRSSFLKDLDYQIKDYVMKNLLNHVNVYENTSVEEIRKDSIITSKGEFEGITFICAGRVPNSEIVEDLVDLNPNRSIVVNEIMQTSIPNIYAAGDVTGGYTLTPVARMEGVTAARNMAGIFQKIDYTNIPQSITLDMPVSYVKAGSGVDTESIKIPGLAGPESFWNILNGRTGFTKIDFDYSDRTIENIYSVSPSSVDDLAYAALFMKLGIDVEDFDKFVEVHPCTDAVSKILKYLY